MSAKHARPAGAGRTAGRRLATIAIVLAAGAAPVLAAAGAQAATAADPVAGPTTEGSSTLPVLGDLPLGLGMLAGPVTQDLPQGSDASSSVSSLPVVGSALPLVSAVPSMASALPLSSLGGVPVDGVPAADLLPRAAPLPAAAAPLTGL